MKHVHVADVRSARVLSVCTALCRTKWPLALCALLAAAWLGRGWLLTRAGHWLNVGEPSRQSDYVLVLPGEEETRPFIAAALVRAGLARQALVPNIIGGPDTEAGIERHAHDIIRDVLVLSGVRRRQIAMLGGNSRSTYTDALALRKFLLARPGSTVAIVTNDFHTRRARLVFRWGLAHRAGDIHMVAAPHDSTTQTLGGSRGRDP